jgi:hypothetical protein
VPQRASHKRTALTTIASNTGWTSVCERLITRRMSLVAVCVSSAEGQLAVARLEFFKQPHILDGDHAAWSANVDNNPLRDGRRKVRRLPG